TMASSSSQGRDGEGPRCQPSTDRHKGPNGRRPVRREGHVPVYTAVRRHRARKGTMTIAEYLQTPETVLPQELIHGVVRVADAPLPRHQRAVAHLFRALDDHVTAQRLGEMWL